MSRPCVFCSRAKSSRQSRQNNCLLSALHVIERYALDGQGVVGSLHDAWMDNLLTSLPVNQNTILRKDVQETPECRLIKVTKSAYDNLLKMIGIEDELRVSINVGFSQVTEGILMLNTYAVPTDRTIRLIDYYHVDQEECLPIDIQVARNILPASLPNNNGTHIITTVRKGIDFTIVLEFPEDENHNEIDSVLEELCVYFIKPTADLLSIKDQQKLNSLKTTVVTQSKDIRKLTENKNFYDICQIIHTNIHRDRNNITLSYILHPVKCIYYDIPCDDRTLCQFDQAITSKIEDKIIPVFNKLKIIEYLFYNNVSPQLQQYFENRIGKICEKVTQIRDMYTEIQQNLATIIITFRRGKPDVSLLDNQLNGKDIATVISELETLDSAVVQLQLTASFINKLKTNYQIEYVNMADYEDSNDEEEESFKGKLFSLNQEKNNCYLCSSNTLIEKNPAEHERLCQQLVQLRQKDSSLHPVFADFSYCSFKLDAMKIFQPPVSSVTKLNEINILLIGETGVGKSTFINAFVNYLVFHSLNDAEKGEPIVLIPVSFLITIGDQFEEEIINFGQSDLNENHNQLGQSVTQQCKSYVFNIDSNTKLRIIDTPGVGDTRGVEQDDKNIEHIFSYINNLSHLNAICFLLKPSTTRINALFRLCFTQLFNFLGPNARENIIFCFTNTRATFYTPGNTAPLLREMLINISPNGNTCLFAKENTFCFDSESFRYLTVIKATKAMVFDDNQKNDFDKSWKMSIDESIRFLRYIKSRPEYRLNACHSIKHAQMLITFLVRPILETLRNVLRNLVLGDMKIKQYVIKMEVQSIPQPGSLCTTGQRDMIQIGDIWIVKNSLDGNRTSDERNTNHCVSNEHLSVFYELKYQLGDSKTVLFYSNLEKLKDRLLHCSLIMTQFLLHTTHISQNPFLSWFNLLIADEEYIYLNEKQSIFHVKLYNNILNMKKKYEKSLNENNFDQQHISLDAVYQCIQEVLTCPTVAEQMNAINTSQMKMMKDEEYDVSLKYPDMRMNGLLQYSAMTN